MELLVSNFLQYKAIRKKADLGKKCFSEGRFLQVLYAFSHVKTELPHWTRNFYGKPLSLKKQCPGKITTRYDVFCRSKLVKNMFHILLYSVRNAKGNIAKSNKSELWNCLSYRGLPYLFEVRSQTFRNNCKISRSQPQNSTLIVIRPQQPRKA